MADRLSVVSTTWQTAFGSAPDQGQGKPPTGHNFAAQLRGTTARHTHAYKNAVLKDSAQLRDNAKISGNSILSGVPILSGNTRL